MDGISIRSALAEDQGSNLSSESKDGFGVLFLTGKNVRKNGFAVQPPNFMSKVFPIDTCNPLFFSSLV